MGEVERAAGASPPLSVPSVPSYEVQLGDSLMSMNGCSMECWKDVVQKACCPGYWGSQCYGMRAPHQLPRLGSGPPPGELPMFFQFVHFKATF